jgi:hypothetical protein
MEKDTVRARRDKVRTGRQIHAKANSLYIRLLVARHRLLQQWHGTMATAGYALPSREHADHRLFSDHTYHTILFNRNLIAAAGSSDQYESAPLRADMAGMTHTMHLPVRSTLIRHPYFC